MGLGAILAPAQVVGYLAFAISLGSFFIRGHRAFLLAGGVGACVWGLHFWQLGQSAAAVIEALSVVRFSCAVWAQTQSVRTRVGFTLLWFLLLAATMQVSDSWAQTSCLAVASGIGIAAGFFLSGRDYRKALLSAEVFWLGFALLSGSLAGIAMALIGSGVNLATLQGWPRKPGSAVQSPA